MSQTFYLTPSYQGIKSNFSGTKYIALVSRIRKKLSFYPDMFIAPNANFRTMYILILVLINRKNHRLKVENKAILRLSNHPSRNCFVLSPYR